MSFQYSSSISCDTADGEVLVPPLAERPPDVPVLVAPAPDSGFAGGGTGTGAAGGGGGGECRPAAACCVTARSASAKSLADAYRLSRFFAKALKTTASTPAGKLRFKVDGRGGSCCAIACMIAKSLSPSNGLVPVTSWYSTTPAAKRSVRASTLAPITCSGDMYFSVPTIEPWVRVASPTSVMRATPKSPSLTRPFGSSITFAGLMSRWMMPCSWAKLSALSNSFMMLIERSKVRRLPWSSCWRRSPPRTSSMTMKARP